MKPITVYTAKGYLPEVSRTRHQHYSPAEVDEALGAMVITGSSIRAAELLNDQGWDVDDRVLRRWRAKDYRERYLELAAQLQPEVERAVVASTLGRLQKSEEVKHNLLGLLAEQIEEKDIKDPAKAYQNISVGQGIDIDSILKFQGRPTQLVQHSSVDESLAALKRLGVVVDSTAEEISEAEVVKSEPAEGAVVAATGPDASEETPAHPLQAALDRPSS